MSMGPAEVFAALATLVRLRPFGFDNAGGEPGIMGTNDRLSMLESDLIVLHGNNPVHAAAGSLALLDCLNAGQLDFVLEVEHSARPSYEGLVFPGADVWGVYPLPDTPLGEKSSEGSWAASEGYALQVWKSMRRGYWRVCDRMQHNGGDPSSP